MFFIKNDVDFPNHCGILQDDINRLSIELQKLAIEQNEDYLEYNKNEEESYLEADFELLNGSIFSQFA